MDSTRQHDRRWNESVLATRTADRQHYVPRLHLSRFERNGLIQAYDLKDDRCFESSPTNLAVEKGYNDFVLGGQVSVSTEDWLADVESRAAPFLSKLVEDPSAIESVDVADEIYLARYLAAQKFRAPGFREFQRQVREQMIEDVKPIAKSYIQNTLPKGEADELWDYWKEKPEEWWLNEEKPPDDAEGAARMLSEVQGWANLLVAANWRTGYSRDLSLYTCDNPLAEYLPPIRPWYAGGGAIWEHGYVFALSPEVLLWVYPLGYEKEVAEHGSRTYQDFSRWEASLARHIITRNATRFLFGKGPYVSPPCAQQCLARIDDINLLIAMRLQGHDPRRPKGGATESVTKLLEGSS